MSNDSSCPMRLLVTGSECKGGFTAETSSYVQKQTW